MLKITNMPFEYRNILNIPRKVGFGLELELDKVDPSEVYKLVKKHFGSSWLVKDDKSLTVGESAEIVTPVLYNNKDTWLLLKKMSGLLEYLESSYDKCSFQVNFDGCLLPYQNDRVRFLKFYAMYEDIIYKLSMSGGKYRESLETYAGPIILALKGSLLIDDAAAVDMFSNQKRYGVSFKTIDKDLIEFRTPNMTNDCIFWQNYINIFYHLLVCSKTGKYDKNEVDKYVENFSKLYILENYERENEEKAIQFAKVILPGTVDRSNFMHQYMGK